MAAPRESRVDLIRGLCLLLIFAGHARFDFSALLQNGRGFSDAAELFVLLAGYACAMAYGRGADGSARDGRAVRRAGRLYLVHIALVAALLALAALGTALYGPGPAYRALRIPAGDALLPSFAQALILAYLPADLDILPLYVLLLLALPLAAALHRQDARRLLVASAALWAVAGLFRMNLPNAASAQGHWYFSPFSWQLVFSIGLVLGGRAKAGLDPLPFHRPLYLAACATTLLAVPAALSLHLDLLWPGLGETGVARALAGKTHVGPLRLVNAMAVLYVLWHWPPFSRWARMATARPVLAAGRNSLPVFTLGLVLSSALAAGPALGLASPLAAQIALALGGCALQLAVAAWLERRRGARAATRLVQRPA